MRAFEVFNKLAYVAGTDNVAADFTAATQEQAEQLMDAFVARLRAWGLEVRDYRRA